MSRLIHSLHPHSTRRLEPEVGVEVDRAAIAPGHAGLEDDLAPEDEGAEVENVAALSVRVLKKHVIAVELYHVILEELDFAAVPDSSAVLKFDIACAACACVWL